MHTMQINVPWSVYGQCNYFMPYDLGGWCVERGLQYSYCGKDSTGDGLTDGVVNTKSVYMVYKIHPDDAIVFKIFFPACTVHHIEQPDYTY